MRNLRLKQIVLLVAIIASTLFFTPSESANAQGAVGGTGSPGGCPSGGCTSGQPSTSNGYGWHQFSANGAGPRDFQNGASWTNVRQQCLNTGNNVVIAFIVNRGDRNPGNARVYDYGPGFGTYNLYLGNSGGNWLTYNDAKSRYDSIDAGLKAGYTWGSNVAWFCYSNQTQWTVRAESYIKKHPTSSSINSDSGWMQANITAQPGEVLYFKHDIRAQNARIDKDFFWTMRGSGFPPSFVINNSGNITAASGVQQNMLFVRLGQFPGSGNANSTVYRVTQNDVGNTLCQNLQWAPRAWNDNSTGNTITRCAGIPFRYTLTPNVNLRSDETVEPGTDIAIDINVGNSGPTKSRQANWVLTEIQVSNIPASTIPNPSGGSSPTPPCGTYFRNARAICTTVISGNTVFNSDGSRLSGDLLQSQTRRIQDLPAGTRLCYALSLQSRSDSDGRWQHSAPVCVTVGKKPKAQVRGGDIRVGSSAPGQTAPAASNIVTSQTRKNIGGINRTFGSWGEYAVSATGIISGVGSGSAFAGPGLATPSNCSYTFLTLSNATNANCLSTPASQYGRYVTGRTFPDVATNFPVPASTPPLSGNNINPATLNGTYRTAGDITISAGVIPKGRSIIINTSNSVTIAGNVTYATDSLVSSSEIPQLIIIANNINILPAVTQLDSWLIARGTLNTCSGVPRETITITNCNAPLTVNGPVMANQLQLWRTAGSNNGAESGDPAEIFNLRPDAYLWGLSQSAKSGRLQTVYEQELPPRF